MFITSWNDKRAMQVDETKPTAVIAFCQNENGQILVVSRKGRLNDWGLIGGKIDGEETPVEALCREFKEEVGIGIHPLDARFIYERIDSVSGHVAWCYEVKLEDTNEKPAAMEPDTAVAWVKAKELLTKKCTFRKYNLGLFKHLGIVYTLPETSPNKWYIDNDKFEKNCDLWSCERCMSSGFDPEPNDAGEGKACLDCDGSGIFIENDWSAYERYMD